MKVACIGMGWWSDVLADAIKRSGKLVIAGCYSRSADKRDKFAAKYGCRPYPSYEARLADRTGRGVARGTPQRGGPQAPPQPAAFEAPGRHGGGGQAGFLRKADRQHGRRR